MSFNIFENPPETEVVLPKELPDRCDDKIDIGGLEVQCRKTHFQGELLHETTINDDSGMRSIRIEWR